jgi:hypothetical protein
MIGDALRAGLAIHETLSAKDFVNYTRAWEEDRQRWDKMMDELPRGKTIKEALSRLALTSYVSS